LRNELMSAFTAQYQFAAAFTVFLVALAGVALVALRAEPLTRDPGARVALGLGFAAIGAAAGLQGSLLLGSQYDAWLSVALLVGVALVVGGSLRWRGSALSKWLLWSGVGGLALAVPIAGADADGVAAAVAAAGGLLIGAALLSASRRAIAARVAASAAATLLLVVLVLSIALSSVLANTVEDQALANLDGRAVQEATAIESLSSEVIKDAGVVTALLIALRDDRGVSVLAQLDAEGNATAPQRALIEAELRKMRGSLYNDLAFGFFSNRQRVVAGDGLDDATVVTIAGSDVVKETLAPTSTGGRASVQVLDNRAFVVAATPIRLRDVGTAERPLGALVAVRALDRTYLDLRSKDGEPASIALAGRAGALAQAGTPQPSTTTARRLATQVLAGKASAATVADGQFVAARPVRAADNRAVVALLSARPTTVVDDVREQLFRTFFIIAFGGAILALLLAAIVGDRIGAGLRRLTNAAQSIQLGELGVRSGVRSEDEVGVLGATFDSMVASIEEQTAALQQAAARVEAIVAGMGEALVAIDADGCVTDFNGAAEELLCIEAAGARGHPVDEVLTATSDDGVDLARRLRALESSRWSALGTLRDGEGTDVPIAMTAGALRDPEGEVTGAVIVLRDLRGEREVERMKRHFLSRVGHELRTPLTPLIGYTQLLVGRDLAPDRARTVYASILGSAKRLERIVEMLEFFASLDAGREVLIPGRLDLRTTLSEVVDARAARLSKGHVLTKRISKHTPAVWADGGWLGRSVDELLDNAVKFSPSGGKVTVTAGPSDTQPGMVEISVRDTGVGMSEEELDLAFTEWTQGDESDTRHFGGLGLGLALVQRVVERHGGQVTCTTTPGKGSKFSILLPALPMEEDGASRSRQRPGRRGTRRSGVRDEGSGAG
jgi:PAS domain S-box-containing protein